MDKRKALVGAVIVALVLVLGVALATRQPSPSKGQAVGEPLNMMLKRVGYSGGVNDWLEDLSDEQAAIIDIPFEDAAKSGYTGTREDWVAQEVKASLDSSGNLVVSLPDGGEFTYTAASKSSTNQNATTDNDKQKGDDQAVGDKDKAENVDTSKVSKVTNGGTVVSVGTVHAQQGEQRVAVPVSIKENPGVMGMTISVSYDEKALTLVGAENGEAFADVLSMTHSRNYASGCLFTWDGIELGAEDVKDGTILTLYFDVAPDASGLNAIAVRSGSPAFDADLNEVDLVIEDGNVVVG